MFEIYKLSKSPRIARRLIQMAELGGLSLDPEIYNLAKKEPIYKNTPNFTNQQEFETMQFIDDRFGRCILLCDLYHDANVAECISLKYAWAQEKLPILIITNTHLIPKTIFNIQQYWLNKPINIYGVNTSAFKEIFKNNKHITITDLPDLNCEIFITKPECVFLGELMRKIRLNQLIINYVTDASDFKNIKTIAPACIETSSTIVILKSDWQIRHMLTVINLLFPQITFEPYWNCEHSNLETRLVKAGINTDRKQWLPILNICQI